MSAITAIEVLLETARRSEYIGESVSQLEHALQAAHLAAQNGDDELVLAALLHDIGHLCFSDAPQMGGVGVLQHELLGADYLVAMGVSKRVATLVAGHVAAKRYLVATKPAYRAKLSAASQETLKHQGGAMTEDEVAAFEARPDHQDLLRLRAWDEAAKLDVEVPDITSYREMLERHCRASALTSDEVERFHREGYLHLKQRFSPLFVERLQGFVSDLESRPETPGKWMKYFEIGKDRQRLLCRIENFLDYEPSLHALISGPMVTGWLSQLMDEEAVLFKEKINFKLAGASGFKPHQDAPAFTSFKQSYHITLMLSFDASHKDNGCLEVVPGQWGEKTLPMSPDLTLDQELSDSYSWQAVPTEPGDIVLFGSYIPHRSGDNASQSSRRALYATYNRRTEGNVRDRYFAEKRRVFPPEIERDPNKDYSDSGVFNVGNPVAAD